MGVVRDCQRPIPPLSSYFTPTRTIVTTASKITELARYHIEMRGGAGPTRAAKAMSPSIFAKTRSTKIDTATTSNAQKLAYSTGSILGRLANLP